MECALWLMKPTMAKIVVMPSTSAMATDRFGMTGFPPSSTAERTERSTIKQYANVPTTRAITRRLNRSRNSVCTIRGEYWLDASWIVRSDTENAIPATVIVAAATVLRSARALSTVEVRPIGHEFVSARKRRSTSSAASPDTIATTTANIGTTNKLARKRSVNALSLRRTRPACRVVAGTREVPGFAQPGVRPSALACKRSYRRGAAGGS